MRITNELRDGLLGKTDDMGRVIAAMPRPKGCEDWVYRDIPWMSVEDWKELAVMLGREVITIACSQGPRGIRGQVLASPKGAEIMRKLAIKGLN